MKGVGPVSIAAVTALHIAFVQASPTFPYSTEGKTASMPPRVCEIRLRAWCITQENSVISDTPGWSSDDPYRTWRIHRLNQPNSNLVIFEPRGCRKALADTVEAIGFTGGLMWEGKDWDEMKVRLRKDGSCDLTLRVPVSTQDPLEWPFAVGRVNLVVCKDEACTLNQPTIADVTDSYKKLREKGPNTEGQSESSDN